MAITHDGLIHVRHALLAAEVGRLHERRSGAVDGVDPALILQVGTYGRGG